MDINPYEYKTDYEDREFANFCLKENVDIICFLANWLKSGKKENASLETIDYWYDRLRVYENLKDYKKNVYLVCSNRIGKEKKVEFVGGSCFVSINPKPNLHKYLNYDQEGIIRMNLYI